MQITNIYDLVGIIQAILWGISGIICLVFSFGNSRLWTSISTGFFLLLISEAYRLNPYVYFYKLAALHYAISTLAIIIITYGFLEYFIFCRALVISGKKRTVYFSIILAIVVSGAILFFSPDPSQQILRNVKMVDNAVWVFFSLFIIYLTLGSYSIIKESDIAKGILMLTFSFVLIIIWKASELYLQIFLLDNAWQNIISLTDETSNVYFHPMLTRYLNVINASSGILASISVGGAFAYIYREMRS